MANWTVAQLYALAASTGFADPITAAAIAMAESGGNPDAVGDTSITPPYGSVGLWQINVAAHPQYDPQSLHDPTTNAQAALAISSGGTTFTPWSTFNSGAYQQFVPAAQAASGSWLPGVTASPLAQVALILAAGAGAAWLIRGGTLEDAVDGLRRFAGRVRAAIPI
jgi:hypothetical protein